MSTSSRPIPWALLVGLLLSLGSLVFLYLDDAYLWYFRAGRTVSFTEPGGSTLAGTYYPGRTNKGIILVEGFGSDQTALRSAANAFSIQNYAVFTFDFSGHGLSDGSLGFDNAATPRLAYQLLAAKETFKQLSRLDDNQIVIMGHSLGARVALQAAAMDSHKVAGLILFGAQVNLAPNAQASLFSGVSDRSLDWPNRLGPQNPPVPILLLSGAWDDILTPANASLLFEKLCGGCYTLQGGSALPSGRYSSPGSVTRPGRDLLILDGLVHNYEIYSPRALGYAVRSASTFLKTSPEEPVTNPEQLVPSASRRIWLWLGTLTGLLLSVISAGDLANARLPKEEQGELCITITSLKRFFIAKLLLWLGALPLAALLGAAFFFLPLPTPVFSLIYSSLIGGYGLLMLGLYRPGRVAGTRGCLPFSQTVNGRRPTWTWLSALGITVLAFLMVTLFARSGLFTLPLSSIRLLWLAILTPLTALGFWVGLREGRLIEAADPGNMLPHIAHAAIGLAPFILWAGLLAALGSLSGMLGSLQGLFTLAFVLLLGRLLSSISARPWLAALLQALMLYWLVLPSSVLIGK